MPTLPAVKFVNPIYKLKKFKGRLFEEWRWERILPPSGTKYFMGSGSSIVLKKELPSLEFQSITNSKFFEELKKESPDFGNATSYQHCNIKINETTFMVTGGFIFNYAGFSYFIT